MKILHLIDVVKPNTVPWLYSLILSIKKEKNLLSGWNYYGQTAGIKTLVFPVSELEGGSFVVKIVNFFIRKWRGWSYLFFIKNNAKDIDLIHAHFAHVGWWNLSLKDSLNVPFIVSFYGYDYESIPHQYPKWNNRYQTLFKRADIFLAEGAFGADKLIKMGCNPSKVKIQRLGVDVKNVPFCKRTKAFGELNLVQIAAVREKKGQAYTLEAFLLVLKDFPTMTLTFVGEDNYGEIQNKISKLPIEQRSQIKYLDRIDFSKIYEFLSGFQVFIHPSCYAVNKDCEGGAPIVLLDAQATGLPVISTFHCDIPEEVIHLKTGLLSEEKNVDQLAESIRRFAEMKQDSYNDYSVEARKHIEDNYDINKKGEELVRIYNNLITEVNFS
ncbi:MAG: glycosyltransferase [Cyclobacteriaceae bacterium]|nr:glycosyltransferase [Cyclobacteriaceae bacterium]